MSRRSRRRFVQGVGLASAALLAGCGRLPWQTSPVAKVARIGWLSPAFGAAEAFPGLADALQRGLQELGYAEGESGPPSGQHYVIERRSGEGEAARLPGLAAELVALPVDVLLTSGSGTAEAARDATSSIPIVMLYPGDPVANGLVASLAHPGGNITGMTELNTQLQPKRLELLKEAVPGISRVAIIWGGDGGQSQAAIDLRDAARVLRVELQELAARGPADLDAVFNDAARASADAVYWIGAVGGRSPTYRSRVLMLASQYRLPVVCAFPEWVEAGALMAYATSFPAMFRRAATYIDKILKGVKPADLPIEQPTTFDFSINLTTAKALGLDFPQSTLIQATEVIQ